MAIKDPTLQLEQQDELYILTNVIDGKSQTMRLTAADVLKLSQSAQVLQERILGSLRREGVDPNVYVPVAQIEVGEPLHGDEILLRLADSNGLSTRFLLSTPLATELAGSLARRLAALQGARKSPSH